MVVLVHGGGGDVARWPLAGGRRPDLRVVDHLARLQLAAGRVGHSVRLVDAPAELWDLLEFLGLAEALTGMAPLRVEAGGETEDGEQAGVEEVVQPDDPRP